MALPNITIDNLSDIQIDKLYIENKSNINIIAQVVVDNSNKNRLDIVALSYYPHIDTEHTVMVIQLICFFNNILRLFDVKSGKSLRLPEIGNIITLGSYTDTVNINGIAPDYLYATNNNNTTNNTTNNRNKSINGKQTLQSKLKIELESAKYDATTGKLIF